MDARVGLWRRLSAEELMLLNCGVGEDSWESLDCKEIQPVNPKGNQSWIFIGRTDAEAVTPILWHLIQRTDSFEKTLMLGKIGGRRRRGQQRMRWLCKEPTHWKRPWCWEWLKAGGEGDTEKLVGWHHWLDGHEFEQAPGVGDRQGSLACCSPWGQKELEITEQLNWIELL